MWIVLWHALLWLPKLVFYVLQRFAVWTGTVYLFRKGKYRRLYYVLSAALYITSWVLLILLIRETMSFKFSHFIDMLPIPKKVS